MMRPMQGMPGMQGMAPMGPYGYPMMPPYGMVLLFRPPPNRLF